MEQMENEFGDEADYMVTLAVYSTWMTAFCVYQGCEIVGKTRGRYRQLGWLVDNRENRAKAALDIWRDGEPIANVRRLLDIRTELLRDLAQDNAV